METKESKKFSWAEWKRPVIAIVLTFLCNVESSMLAMGEWPYMTIIDHEATSAFFGFANAANKAGHAVFSFVFAFWAHRISGIKIPMLAGRSLTLISCVMYILVEFIPSNRRWWMLVCYVLFGAGFGTSPLLRSYIARVTTDENRSTAYAMQNGAIVLSCVVGPIAQLSFAGLPYPGAIVIPPHIKLNIYTAPIWFAVITNVIAIVITVFLLQDTEVVEMEKRNENATSKYSISSIRGQLSRLTSLNLPWALVVLVILEKMISLIFNSTMGSVAGPMMTSMYALDGRDIVLIMAISQVIVRIVVTIIERRLSYYVFSNIVVIAGYVITYPYPFMSSPMQPFNETSRLGCNPLEYSWCDYQLVVNLIPFIIILMIGTSFAVPAAMLSLDTIYSKIIGDIDQNVMQAVFVVAEDIMLIVAPIYATAVFTAIGINYLQIINGAIYILGTIVWLAVWRWLQPYN